MFAATSSKLPVSRWENRYGISGSPCCLGHCAPLTCPVPTNCTLKGSRMTTGRRGESHKPLSLLPSPTWQISKCGRTLQSHQHSKSWPMDHRLLRHSAYVPHSLYLLGSIERTKKGRTPLQMRNRTVWPNSSQLVCGENTLLRFPGLHRQVCSEWLGELTSKRWISRQGEMPCEAAHCIVQQLCRFGFVKQASEVLESAPSWAR